MTPRRPPFWFILGLVAGLPVGVRAGGGTGDLCPSHPEAFEHLGLTLTELRIDGSPSTVLPVVNNDLSSNAGYDGEAAEAVLVDPLDASVHRRVHLRWNR